MPTLTELTSLSLNGEKINIITSVASSWEEICILMEFDSIGNHLNLVKKKFGGSDPIACCRDIFQHWLQGNGKLPTTWRTLTELLEDIGCSELSKTIRRAIRF